MTDDIPPFLPPPQKQEPTQFQIPEKIGKYVIEGLLDRGGMSLLYLGIHPELKEPVIVKVLSPKYLANPEVVLRFLNEARIISLTDHPNIIKLYDYGQWENGLYIAMEFIRGNSLRKLLMHQPFSLRKALSIILQIAYALCHLHTHGVVHGDLKPENILITNQGQVKVIDFGIAKILGEKMKNEEKARLIGTPIYMSPESRENVSLLSFQSDIYSLGIIAYELVLGRITHGKVILSLAPKGMQPILNKALQARLEDRYQDIVDFILDLATYMNSESVQQDKHGSDYFFELFDHLETFQKKLLPAHSPLWLNVEIGHLLVSGMGLGTPYYDFFDISPTKKMVLSAVFSSKGVEAVLFSSMIRSVARTLCETPLPPQAFFENLLEVIQKDPLFATLEKFMLSAFFLDLETKEYECFSMNGLLLLDSMQKIVGMETKKYTQYKASFSKNTRLCFIHSLSPQKEELIRPLFLQTQELSPQKQAENMVQKMRMNQDLFLFSSDRPLFICILKF